MHVDWQEQLAYSATCVFSIPRMLTGRLIVPASCALWHCHGPACLQGLTAVISSYMVVWKA